VIRHLRLAALLVCSTLLGTFGCRSKPTQPATGLIPANAFMRSWGLQLELKNDRVTDLFLRDNNLFAYTANNRVFAMSATGGELLALMHPTPRGSVMRPPVVLTDKWVIPTTSTLEVFKTNGRLADSILLDRATRGSAGGLGSTVYIGLDYPGDGRLAKIDVARPYGRMIWELLTFGAVAAAPVVLEDAIYVASEDGRVFAVAPDFTQLWSLEGGYFRTGGGIKADLRADSTSVYVASLDSKLYSLDRNTGKIRWRYFAGAPLLDSPAVTDTGVYIYARGAGLVAIDKNAGKDFREPMWIAGGIRKFLSADDKFVYALAGNNSIVALDVKTGEAKFQSTRNDLRIFAQNTKDSTIYAATASGEIVAIKPVLKPGTVGQIVLHEVRLRIPAV
jgi:outer membrane protein assembly factor BamB